MKLEQIKDWESIKEICDKVRQSADEQERKNNIDKLYNAIQVYYHTYNDKFDYHKNPIRV